MIMIKTPQLAYMLALTAFTSSVVDEVAAHSKMLVPVTEFQDGSSDFTAVGRLDGSQWTYPTTINSWDGAGLANDAMKQSGVKTLRQFVMKYYKPTELATTKECGQTVLTGTRQPVPDAVHFPAGHEGPCEYWCDNHRIAFHEDCKKDKIELFKVDKSKCSKASIIQGMYIGTQAQPWEIYINCAPIAGGTETDPSKVLDPNASGDGSGPVANESSGSNDTSAKNATTVPAATPASTPVASVSPVPTSAPVPAPTPAAGTNCKRRRQ